MMKEFKVSVLYALTAVLKNGANLHADFSDSYEVVYSAKCSTKQVENFQTAHVVKNCREAARMFQLESILLNKYKTLNIADLDGATFNLAYVRVSIQ